MSAATPAVSADAMSVKARVWDPPPGAGTLRPAGGPAVASGAGATGGPAAPGAVSATYDPVLVNGASSPSRAVAPTAMTPGYAAGELTALPPPPLSPAGA